MIDNGLTEAGATSDVLTAYEAIDNAGGIAIAAHANSSNGVSMRNMNLGGQTRIAFTQDPHLAAIEFTDLDNGTRRSSAYLFTGVKTEYPRRMHALQGSDAHFVTASPTTNAWAWATARPRCSWKKSVSMGSRRFCAARTLITCARRWTSLICRRKSGTAISKPRASLGPMPPSPFTEVLAKKGERLTSVVRDICAMANGEGGAIFIGSGDAKVKKIAGVGDADAVVNELANLAGAFTPSITFSITVLEVDGKAVVRVGVQKGKQAPYALAGDVPAFLVRTDAETRTASRDEIVALAHRGLDAIRPAAQPRPPQHQQPHGRNDQRNERNDRERNDRDRRDHQRRERDQRPPIQSSQPAPASPSNNGVVDGPQRGDPRPPQRDRNEPRQPQEPREPRQPSSNVGRSERAPGGRGGQGRGGLGGNPRQQNRGVRPGQSIVSLSANRNLKEEKAGPETPVEPVPAGSPRTGVQVIDMEERSGAIYFMVRDLRNNLVVRNVTMKSARDLWHYAISQYAEHPGGPEEIDWRGDRCVLDGGVRAGKMRYDLALRDEKGAHVFYGVMQEGLDDGWKELIAEFDNRQPTDQDQDA